MELKDLTNEQLIKLRTEIVLNSPFIRHYENSFGIDPHNVYDFFDSYLEKCEYIPNENGDLLCDLYLTGYDYYCALFDIADNYDNLIDYFNTIEWEE